MPTQLETARGILRVPTGTWAVDPVHSSVEFRVKHMMISTVRGRFGVFEGTIEAAPDYHDSKVHGTIDAASIDTNDTRRDNHLRSADFFDVENHPTIRFESTTVEHVKKGDYRVTGDLTMHGWKRHASGRWPRGETGRVGDPASEACAVAAVPARPESYRPA